MRHGKQGEQALTTQQSEAKQMADRELDKVNGGLYHPDYDGPILAWVNVMKRQPNRTFSYTECNEKGQ